MLTLVKYTRALTFVPIFLVILLAGSLLANAQSPGSGRVPGNGGANTRRNTQINWQINGQSASLNIADIPAACANQCSILSSISVPCETFSFPFIGISTLLTNCENALCSSATTTSLVACLNCLVANGEPGLTAQDANSFLANQSSICRQLGATGTFGGTVSATPTTTYLDISFKHRGVRIPRGNRDRRLDLSRCLGDALRLFKPALGMDGDTGRPDATVS
ncbi:hypothetical protein JCM24511_04182 [Saitozyma sp. JCM 24511]|nr:hypothetical protein JCM24511_04182 [Saitozyma sp. JCM 24511]